MPYLPALNLLATLCLLHENHRWCTLLIKERPISSERGLEGYERSAAAGRCMIMRLIGLVFLQIFRRI